MKDKAETRRAAQEMFTYVKEMLQSVYDEQIPFILIYAPGSRREMLTNIQIEEAKRLLDNAMNQMSNLPEHLKP